MTSSSEPVNGFLIGSWEISVFTHKEIPWQQRSMAASRRSASETGEAWKVSLTNAESSH